MRRVLITGASGAFGRAASDALRARGARVAGLDLHGDEEAGIFAGDVTDDASTAAAVSRAIEHLGGLDVLVNNAGIGAPIDVGRPPGETVERFLAVNLLGPWRVTAHALEALLDSRGRVVNIASRAAWVSVPLSSAYSVSKRALTAYSDALRAEYGTQLHVTTIYPAFVNTPIHEATRAEGLRLEGVSRTETLEQVAAAIVRACEAARPPRDLAVSRGGRLQIAAARHLPRLADRMVARQIRKQHAQGAFDDSRLAEGLRARLDAPG